MSSFADMGMALAPLLPILIVFAGSLLLLLLDTCLKSFRSSFPVFLVTVIFALWAIWFVQGRYEGHQGQALAFSGMVYLDPFSAFVSALLLLGTLLAGVFMEERRLDQGIESPAEFYSLVLMSTAGAMLFAISANLLMVFLALETMSMALYALCGSSLRGDSSQSHRSAEAALKYFFLGSFSSAFLLFGMALIYGLTGSLSINELSQLLLPVDETVRPVLSLGIGLILVGLLFKVGTVPFHFWTPDVYHGAPTAVTAYMASVVKAAAIVVVMRVLWIAFGSLSAQWEGGLVLIAGLTMVGGNLIAVRQRNVKRMLAYSSIAHAGYMTSALLIPSNQFGGGCAILFYLIAYALMTTGAFATLMLVCSGSTHLDRTGNLEEGSGDISHFRGLGFREPMVAALLSLFLLALAGLPPGFAGLAGKLYIFSALIKGDFTILALVGVLASAVSCFYYLRVIVAMYFEKPVEGEEPIRHLKCGFLYRSGLVVCAIGVILMGIFPNYIYERADVVMFSVLGR